MGKILDKIKKLFGGKSVCKTEKKEEPKPEQQAPKPEQKSEEQKN